VKSLLKIDHDRCGIIQPIKWKIPVELRRGGLKSDVVQYVYLSVHVLYVCTYLHNVVVLSYSRTFEIDKYFRTFENIFVHVHVRTNENRYCTFVPSYEIVRKYCTVCNNKYYESTKVRKYFRKYFRTFVRKYEVRRYVPSVTSVLH
jgi:hypothetical protein